MNEFVILKGVSVGYEENPVLSNFSLELEKGCKYSVIGPSGCGKTTLLYTLAGILKPREGAVTINGLPVDISRKGTSLILQSYGLFPWKTVWDNMMLPHLLERQVNESNRLNVKKLISELGLSGMEHKYPSQLSGGQKQRVAIGRAWVQAPDLLLMDEPFSALDAMTRERLQETLLSLEEGNHRAMVLVTHSIEEAVFMSSQIIVMNNRGGIHQILDNKEQGSLAYRDEDIYYEQCKKLRQLLKEASHEV